MRLSPQAKFRRKVRRYMADTDLTVGDLALKIGRRRDTVSTAINQYRFPRVRKQIEEVIAS